MALVTLSDQSHLRPSNGIKEVINRSKSRCLRQVDHQSALLTPLTASTLYVVIPRMQGHEDEVNGQRPDLTWFSPDKMLRTDTIMNLTI